MIFRLWLFVTSLITMLVGGCYQIQSDDDLRAIPTTNNPNVVPSGGRGTPMPKAGF